MRRPYHRPGQVGQQNDLTSYQSRVPLLMFLLVLASRLTYSIHHYDTIGNFNVLTLIMYRVFIKYCVFSKISKYIPDSGLSRFPLGVSECTQWQVNPSACSRTCRVQKNHNILRKHTIFNEHPVYAEKAFLFPLSINDNRLIFK